MTEAIAQPLRSRARAISLAEPGPWKALTAALLVAGVVIGAVLPMADVSWLLIAGERVLQGQRLYADILEVNPPLAVFAYMPALAIAGPLGVPPELVVAVLCALGAGLSLGLSGLILKPLIGGDALRTWKLAAAGAFILGVLPMAAFGEREHLAVMALMPFLALAVLRSEGQTPHWPLSLLAGLGLGLAVCLKPHFAAIAVGPELWVMWRARSFRPWAQVELWVGVAMISAYALAILAFFPDYLARVVPLVRAAYLPIRAPLWLILMLPGIPLAAGAAMVARLMRLEGRWLAAPLLASLGGAAAFMLQGKGWPYHAYPMLAFAVLGLLAAAAMVPQARACTWSLVDRGMLLAPGIAAMVWLSWDSNPAPLARQVEALGSGPRLIAVSGNLGMGIPVARAAGALWVGREPSEWISDGVLRREEAEHLAPAERKSLDALAADERARLAVDIAVGRPDIVLFDRKRFDWRAWALADPDIARSLSSYRLAANVEGVEVWARPGR